MLLEKDDAQEQIVLTSNQLNAARNDLGDEDDDGNVGELKSVESAENSDTATIPTPNNMIEDSNSYSESSIIFSDSNDNENDNNKAAEEENILITELENYDDPANWPENINDKLRQLLIRKGPIQNKNVNLPSTRGQGRTFNNSVFSRKMKNNELVNRNWLVYSIKNNAVFCFCCRLFPSLGVKSKNLTTGDGDCDWKHVDRVLRTHETSCQHVQVFQKWKELEIQLRTDSTIDKQSLRLYEAEIKHWKSVIERIIAVIQFLGQQCLTFRGSSETLYDNNNGNFLKLIELLGKFDLSIGEHIKRVLSHETKSVNYLGKMIQNELISIISEKIKSTIVNNVLNAKYYSIIVDCTPDKSNVEQMTIVVRYVTVNGDSPSIEEHFLGFIPLTISTGEEMTNIIQQYIKDLNLDIKNIQGQGYDNGANMFGKFKGVQSRILEINKRAFFVPCGAHTLNLVVNDAASTCIEAVEFFSTIQQLYTFFHGSVYRWDILKKHVTSLTLKPLSDTRWESRIEALKPLRYFIGEVYDALLEVTEDTTRDLLTKSEAKNLAIKLKSFQFICSIVVWYEILYNVNIASKMMQSPSLDLPESNKILEKVKSYLETLRTEEGFEKILVDAKELAEQMEVPAIFLPTSRLRRRKKHFDYEQEDDPIQDAKKILKLAFILLCLMSLLIRFRKNFGC